jgi:hypothetical protein
LGLYAPFVLLGLAIVVWSFVWLALTSTVERRLDALRGQLAASGGRLDWQTRTVSGFPFRIDVNFTDLAWRDASGLAVAAPTLKTEAFAWAPGHWVASAPGGVTVTRPGKGDLIVTARVFRASLFDLGAHPPRLSLEGLGLTFTPGPGADSFFVESASELHIHTRAGPDNQGAFYVELDKAIARPDGLLGAIAAGKPLTLIADAIYARADAFSGATWTQAVKSWSAAGGRVDVRRLLIQPGDVVLDARGEDLTVDPDGRLRGALQASFAQAPRALTAMADKGRISPQALAAALVVLAAQGPSPTVRIALGFQAGRTTLGPVALGPAPKVY